MLRPSDPLLRPDQKRAITDECDPRMLLNPGRMFAVRNDEPTAELRDQRELLAVAS